MRLWSLHPRYLDAKGLVALWREALLARAVLAGTTRGYHRHPQLERLRACGEPLPVIDAYLWAVHAEAEARGYRFDRTKPGARAAVAPLPVTTGQLAFEWRHLCAKLATRSPAELDRWREVAEPDCHPLFVPVAGPIATWEKGA